jgi:hypothetical protein
VKHEFGAEPFNRNGGIAMKYAFFIRSQVLLGIMRKFLPILFLVFSTSGSAAFVSSIVDDFEGDLSQWVGKNEESFHGGFLTADPLDATNQVLSFNRTIGAGDVFTIDSVSTSSTFTVSFDYLGTCGTSDCGGYFGISLGFPEDMYWVAGTGSVQTPLSLIDDGTWHSYDLTFNNPYGTSPVHFMLEDWHGSPGGANNVFFDNFSFFDTAMPPSPVSEPSILSLMTFGLVGGWAGMLRRRRKDS